MNCQHDADFAQGNIIYFPKRASDRKSGFNAALASLVLVVILLLVGVERSRERAVFLRILRNRWISLRHCKRVRRNSRNVREIGQFKGIASRYSVLSAPNGHSYPVLGIGRQGKRSLCLRKHVKVGTEKQRKKAVRILLQTAIDCFGIAELLLNDSENMLDLTANRRFSVIDITFPVK